MPLLSRLRPAQALVHDAVDATTYLVGEGHDSAARSVVGALSKVPALEAPAKVVDSVRHTITHGVLSSVRGVNRLVEGVSGVALSGLPEHEEPAVPLRSDAVVTTEGAVDQLVGVLNGAVGDHLSDSENGLDLGLRLRHEDRWLNPSSPCVPNATKRVVVLVHGLSTTELSWSLQADEGLGSPELNYGELLRQELGYTPLFVRYNTGRTVEDNGRALAEALDTLLDAWPVELEELVLIGHSMGGLVARASTSARCAHRWRALLTHLICLGSPHAGAPLARFGERAAQVCNAVDLPLTQIVGRILSHRSAGVKELQHRRLDACGPLLPHVRYLFVAGSVTTDPDVIGTQWLGDLLVPVESAHDPKGIQVQVRHVGRVMHHRLQTDAGVWAAVRDHVRGVPGLGPAPAPSTPAAVA